MVLSRRKRKVGDSFHAELIPHRAQVSRLVELHLVRDGAGAEFLVGRVLQVPAGLLLLHKLAHNGPVLFGLILGNQGPPHFQVLGRIAFLVLGVALPRDDVCAQGREAKLEDVRRGERGDDVADGGIDDRDPRSPD